METHIDIKCACGARAKILAPLPKYNRSAWIKNELRFIGWERRYMGYICEACLVKEDAERKEVERNTTYQDGGMFGGR